MENPSCSAKREAYVALATEASNPARCALRLVFCLLGGAHDGRICAMSLIGREPSAHDDTGRVARLQVSPSGPRGAYPRNRITRRIQEAASYGIGLMVAAAGYGKTEALRHTYDSDSAIIVELDDRITTIEPFLKKLLSMVVPRHTRSFAALLEKTAPEAACEILIPWVAARIRGVELPIVIDDLHRVFRDDRAPAAIQQLIESTRHSVIWVLSSRETPELPIGTWIAREWMHRPISASDLAFRDDEGLALAELLRVDIGAEDVHALVEDTGGWPIALRLSLTTWADARDRLPTGMRTRDVLFRYIEEQVWHAVEPEHRALLEIAAFLPQPSVAILGAAGFPRAGIILERLSRRISFVQRDESGEFHLHDIFREFITEQHRLDPERFENAVSTVAHALAKLGLSAEALRLFTRLKAEENILAILSESGFSMIETGEKEAVKSALLVLAGKRRDDPIACGLRGHLLSLEGAFTAAEAEMRRAIAAKLVGRFYIAVARRLAMFWVNRANYGDAVTLIEELLRQVAPESVDAIELHADLSTARGTAGDTVSAMNHAAIALEGIVGIPIDRRAQVLARVATAHYFARNHAQAEEIANEAVALATQLGLDHLASRVYSLLYSIAHETHQDTTRAEFYARAMGAAAENAGDRQMRVASLERLLEVATNRGDDDVIAQAEQELASAGQIRLYRDSIGGRATRAVHEVGRRNFKQARRIMEGLDVRELSTAENGLRTALHCLCMAADGQRDEAAQILEKPFLIEVESDLYSRRYLSVARGYRALANWMLGRGTMARQALARDDVALTEGQRIFMEVVASICGTKRSSASERVIHQLTEPLVALNFGGLARFLRALAVVSYLPVLLTRAEVDLLRAWRSGDTISELADRIGKSPHTINTQMRAICRKTGTSGRAEALAFAREHGLV